ncbi:MAG: DivIVA domain-containing protein [Clostridiales bacterium]|nr:DivIVA domain-containing protein [Clostridiales bacterium]
MITAQDIREKTFEKSRFGGYDMASVDDFLEELADDITASQKENAVLKSKMKVLVDKIEEYRANEEALNMAVLSAQKLAVQIENDARSRAAAMIADAERQVKAQIGSISEQTAAEEKRLAAAKEATAKFFLAARELCNKQLENIDAISSGILPQQEPASVKAAAPAVSVEDAVRSIESSMARIQPEPPVNIDIDPAEKAPAAKPAKSFDSTQPFTL